SRKRGAARLASQWFAPTPAECGKRGLVFRSPAKAGFLFWHAGLFYSVTALFLTATAYARITRTNSFAGRIIDSDSAARLIVDARTLQPVLVLGATLAHAGRKSRAQRHRGGSR